MMASEQHYLRYLIELEAFSMLFRPRATDTEFIQFQRSDYTPATAVSVFENIKGLSLNNDSDGLKTAALVFIYLMKTDQLQLMHNPRENDHQWFVRNEVTSQTFDFSTNKSAMNDRSHLEAAQVAAEDGMTSAPTQRCFDLLERIESSSRRYPVDERITLENCDSSDFIAQKRGIDYLYQQGVFGKFDKFNND